MGCPECGFDPSSVSPADAIVALRSFPRRYRELLAPSDSIADDERRWAAVMTGAAEAAAAIEDVAGDVEAVLVRDEPPLQTDDGVATTIRYPGDPKTALDRLALTAGQLADRAASHHGSDWSRKGVRVSGPVSALDLLRDAVHAGVHHLRAAEADLA